jgi:hypothetical protein
MGLHNQYSFNLDVYDAPRFSRKLDLFYEIRIGGSLLITLPLIKDINKYYNPLHIKSIRKKRDETNFTLYFVTFYSKRTEKKKFFEK